MMNDCTAPIGETSLTELRSCNLVRTNRGISSLKGAAISRVLRNPRAVASGGSMTCHSQRGRLRVECVGCYESLCKSTSEYSNWDHSSWLSRRLGFYRGACDISDDH